MADAGAEYLLLQYDADLPVAGVEDALAFHPRLDGRVHVFGEAHELGPEPEDLGGVLGGGEQAGDDGVLVDPEQGRLLVQRHR